MASFQPARWDERREPRNEVLHRTRVIQGNGLERSVTIVNVSANGFMARADGEWAQGDMVSVVLPIVGLARAEVRWVLGGRLGCRLMEPVALEPYQAMLALMMRGG